MAQKKSFFPWRRVFTVWLVAGMVQAALAAVDFEPAVNYPVGLQPRSIVAADFNRDGKLDLATVNSNSDNVSVMLGDGNGTFAAALTFTVGLFPWGVAVGDFN